jgi:chitin synthase
MCGTVGFITIGLQKVFCPQVTDTSRTHFLRVGSTPGVVGIQGYVFNTTQSTNVQILTLAEQFAGQDITNRFSRPASYYTACNGFSFRAAVDDPCGPTATCDLGPLNTTSTFNTLHITNQTSIVGYSWQQVANLTNFLVIDGAVLNMDPYMTLHPRNIPGDTVDTAIRTVLRSQSPDGGKDATMLFYHRTDLKSAVPCIMERYYAGNIDKITPGCFVSQLVLYAGLVVILGLVFIRFAMACVFNWFLSRRLAGNVSSAQLNKHAISPAVMPEGANVSVDNVHGTAPWAGPGGSKKLVKPGSKFDHSTLSPSSATLITSSVSSTPVMNLARIGAELFAVCLVTCYSEGEESLRTTLDSISATSYSDTRKLLFVVADGMITGAGEKRSTPDICVSLLDPDPRFGNPMPMSYIAVGSGAKQENRAMVYAGHYSEHLRSHPSASISNCTNSRCRKANPNSHYR